ncbi:MAG: ABC transporter permease [Planctomycetota bacterium JB042]
MSGSVPTITPVGLALAFLPALVVLAVMARWRAGAGSALHATARMLAQLLLIGYVLIAIFESDDWRIIGAVLLVMLLAAGWIAIRPLGARTARSYGVALAAIAVGGVPTLALVTQAVVRVDPWFSPRFVVPLAGMIFAGAMNAVSLAAERVAAELERGVPFDEARRTALRAALIPILNSLFAVGLVSLPGMMTGQILSGVSPLIAAKYQIVVMTMLFGSTGMAAATYLVLRERAA